MNQCNAEAEAEANAKGRGRGKGSRDFLNTFYKVTTEHAGLGDATQLAAPATGNKQTKFYTIRISRLFQRVQQVTTLICRFEFQTPQ